MQAALKWLQRRMGRNGGRGSTPWGGALRLLMVYSLPQAEITDFFTTERGNVLSSSERLFHHNCGETHRNDAHRNRTDVDS